MSTTDISLEAFEAIKPVIGKIQKEVLALFKTHGPMTALVAERKPEVSQYGFSTVRVRISEMMKLGLLEEAGVDRSRRAPATIYGLTPEGEALA